MATKYPSALLPIIAHLKKLPGVGARTAERFAFELLSWPQEELTSLALSTSTVREKIPPCSTCGCLTDLGSCSFCDLKRTQTQLCIVSSPREVFAIESTGSYRGLYHVIEHLVSPMDHRHASSLNLQKIEERLTKCKIEELILAFDSTLEGDTTALYLKNHFADFSLSISRLAFGIPVGSSLEYIDGGTLGRALSGRQTF